MTKLSEIKQKLKEIVGVTPNIPFTATVTELNGAVCTIEISDGFFIPDVKLRATNNVIDNQLLITPKIGSKVTVLSLTGSIENLTVINVDEIQKIEIQQGELLFLIDGVDGKVAIKKGSHSLLSAIEELISILKTKYKVFTPAGPSGTALPDSVSELNNIKDIFKTFLK